MNSIESIMKRAVNACMEDMSKEKPIRRRFCFPIDKETATRLLNDAYRVEVESRLYPYSITQDIKAQLSAVAEWLTNPARKPSILLYGRTGTGKTTMARSIKTMAKRLKDSYSIAGINRLQNEMGTSFPTEVYRQFERLEYFVIVPDFTTALDIAKMAKENREEFDRLCRSKFLIVDDIGTEPKRVNSYGTEYLPIAELIQRRYDSSLPTIITTNLGDAEIEGTPQFPGYGQRTMDRLNEMCEKIPYGARSFRV